MTGVFVPGAGLVPIVDHGIAAPGMAGLVLLSASGGEAVRGTWRNWRDERLGDSFAVVLPSHVGAVSVAVLPTRPEEAVSIRLFRDDGAPIGNVVYDFLTNPSAQLADFLARPGPRFAIGSTEGIWIGRTRW